MKIPKVKISTKDLCNMHNLLAKLNNTPITLNKNACAINRVAGQLENRLVEAREKFTKDVLAKYALKDEKGRIKYDDHGIAQPDPTRLTEYEAELAAFDKIEHEFQMKPLTPSNLVDIKLTAKEIGQLGEFFTEQEGPGVPSEGLHALQN